MTVAECIHGLPIGDCESCSPREAPVAKPLVRAPRGSSSRVAGAKAVSATGLATRADARRYLVLDIDDLGGVLGSGPLGESEGWRLEPGDPTSRDRVVLVSVLSDPDELQILGVANEPARRRVGEVLDAAGRDARVVVNPVWFA